MAITEADTRQIIIDKKLAEAGWNVNDQTQVNTEYHIIIKCYEELTDSESGSNDHQYADYVLLGRDGKPLAVVEAKRTSVDADKGREQAKQYCENIKKHIGGELPFCFYTNGYEINFWDLDNYPPRKIVGFPTRDDLERLLFIRKNRKPLALELINTKIAGRDYQIQAIRSVMESIEKKHRKFLLVMATGTGKTRTCIALVNALMRAGWAERILFLVDRIALRDQTLDAFKEHLENEPRWPKPGEKIIKKDRRIYVSTYPTMLNIVQSEHETLSPHFFDLVVVDESHRSIYNTYQEILDYFNTITLGLTATPTNVIDHNTFKLFNCEDGIPTFAYSYEEAVNNLPPYLCSFQVMKLQTKFQVEGINKRTISLEDQKKLIHEGKEIEEINFEGTELEKTVTNRGTNVTIVKEFMEECIKDSDGVLPGKTIFFCSSKGQAKTIENIFDTLYPEYSGKLARMMVSNDPRVYGKGGLIDQFTNKNFPRVAISVDMLDTGIDVRELVNLVFAKPVYSYTKFWQMIGRGTRLLESTKLKPWCPEKQAFLIMDCWDNFEYFKLNPKGRELNNHIPLPVRYAALRIDKITVALEKEEKDIAIKEIRKLREQIDDLPEKSIVIKDAATDLNIVKDDAFWDDLTDSRIEHLRLQIQPLFRVVSQTDFKAMRFRKDLLEISLSHLKEEKQRFDSLKDGVIEQVSTLPMSINIVAKHTEYIQRVQSKAFWLDVKDSDFDVMENILSPLIKYRQQETGGAGKKTVLNLRDVLQIKEMVEFGPQNESVTISQYRELVEQRIMELSNENPVLKKIKSGQDISDEEKLNLAEKLQDDNPHITVSLLRKVYKQQQAGFIQLIKHIMGIEILEDFNIQVSNAIQNFIQEHTNLTTRQIEFLNLLKDYIIDRGKIEKRDLIQAPFTVIHPKGIRGVFSQKEINDIVKLTEQWAA